MLVPQSGRIDLWRAPHCLRCRAVTSSNAARPGDQSDRDLRDLVDDERHRQAVADRRQLGWLLRQAAEETTFSSVLVLLAGRRADVAVDLAGGRTVHGTLVEAGTDFAVLRPANGPAVLVALAAVLALRSRGGPDATPALGADPEAGLARRDLADVLRDLAAEGVGAGAGAVIWLRDGTHVDGPLTSVGVDVVAVQLHGSHLVHVPLGAVACVQVG